MNTTALAYDILSLNSRRLAKLAKEIGYSTDYMKSVYRGYVGMTIPLEERILDWAYHGECGEKTPSKKH